MVEILIKKADGSIVLPSYETIGAAGADVRAYLPNGPISLKSGEYTAVPTGLYPEIPVGYEMQVRPRSGLAAKRGVTVLNAPGTVDSDYRGEIKVLLINHSKDEFIICSGDRIAQLVIAPVVQGAYVEAKVLSETTRGEGGFGSTGV